MVHISLAGYGEVSVQIPKRTLLDEGAIGDSIEESILSQHQTTTSSESALLSGGSSVKGYDKHAAVNVKVKTEEYIRRLHKEMNAMKRKNKTLEKEINSMKKVRAADIKRIRQLESEKATLEQGIKQAEDNIKLLELQLQYRNEVAKVELKTAEAEREKAEAQRKTAEAQRDKAEAERDKAEAVNMAAMTRVESQAKIAQMEVQ